MSLGTKVLIGLGAISSIAGGGIVLNNYLSVDNIQSKLEAKKFKVLEDTQANKSTWEKILTSYKVVAKTDSKFKFTGFDGEDKDGTKGLDILKQKCKDLLVKSVSEDKENQLFNQAKKWCIVPISVSKLLSEEGYTNLNFDKDNANLDKEVWEKKISDHKGNTISQDKKISDLALNGTKDLENIKDKCKTISESENYTEKFEIHLENYKTWCSKKQ